MTSFYKHKRKPKPHQSFTFPSRRYFVQPDETEDEAALKAKLVREWLKNNETKKLPAGWSRYGYQPG